MTLRRVAITLLLLCAIAAPRVVRAEDGPLETAAYSWLKLLDTERWADAWREAGPLMRDGVTESEWIEATKRVREAWGPIESRTTVDKGYHRQIDGGPDGNYFTLRIQTHFANGGEKLEIVTLTTTPTDQQYRAVAYGIKR
jgi:hypothetical protein